MRKHLLYYTIIILCLSVSISTHGEIMRFSALKTQTNTPYSNINDIFSDSYGLLWLATENGLIKYNGYEYNKCEQDTSAEEHYNNFIRVFEDSKRRLWVGTDKGLAIYDRNLGKFRHIDLKVCNSYVFGITEDSSGNLWILSQYGIMEMNADAEYVTRHELPNKFSSMVMGDKVLWIGSTQEGLCKFDIETQKVEHVSLPFPKGQEHKPRIHTITQASNGKIFIGTRNEGLIIYDPIRNTQINYSKENLPEQFVSNFVTRIYEDSKQRVWIGFVNGKLLLYDLKTGNFIENSIVLPSTIDKVTINSITEDNHHNMWFGTHHYWLFFSGNTSNSFDFYKHSSENVNSITNNTVTSFLESNGKILIGTDGGGYNIQTPHTDKFSSIKEFGNIILDLKKGQGDDLWFAAWGNSNNGVTKYNSVTGETKNYSKGDAENTLPTNYIHHILVEGDSVWVATDGAGICLINDAKGTVTSKQNSNDSIFSEDNPQWASHIMRDHLGRLWICTSDGVVCHDVKGKKKYTQNDQKTTLAQNEAKMCFLDSKKRIWLITATGGLNIFDEESQTFMDKYEKYHLPKTLNAIIEDNQGNLWISATNEIILFNPDQNMVRHFDMEGDLEGYAFAPNAMYKTNNGEIYVGSNNGYFVFSPQEIINKGQYEPTVFLKDLYINGKRAKVDENSPLNGALTFTDTLRLNYDENHFSIEYFGIDYGQTENLTYYYMMEGLSDQWIFVGKERRASFTNFDAGTYTFLVKVCEQNGERCSTSRPLTIIIAPAWWQTWWFRVIAIVLVFLIFHIIFKLRERQLRQRQEELEKLVAERTEELRLKNKKIEQQNKQLDETLNLKDRIMSIIAHDLRNPVTAIVGNLSLLTSSNRQYNQEEQSIKVQQTYKSAKKLQDQMENLLEWSRIQNNTILFSPSDYYMDALTKESITLLQNLLNEKEIEVTLRNQATHSAHIDQRMVSSIIRNLLNNAIKFTPKGGKIAIENKEDNEGICWSITDNGIGMDEEQIRKLTEENHLESTFGTNNEKGSGLGLMICHDFILKNNGRWEISSVKGEGTTFTLHFPKGTLYQTAPTSESTETITQETTATETKQYKILLVDDNDEIRSYLADLFSDWYDVLTANNGRAAFEIAQNEIPDIIISDVVMPEMDGKTFCHKIKEEQLTQHIPVILLTTEATVDNQIEGINLGADDYVTKPFNGGVLKAKVASMLKNKELQREHIRRSVLNMPKMEIPESQDDQFLRKINETISENISESNLTVEFLAEKTALSRVQLFRKFKAITGCSPSEYIKAVRLQHAADILQSGKHNIADVAYNVGFSDPKYFSNCFSEKFGMTPTQFVKKYRPDN